MFLHVGRQRKRFQDNTQEPKNRGVPLAIGLMRAPPYNVVTEGEPVCRGRIKARTTYNRVTARPLGVGGQIHVIAYYRL